MFTCIKAYIPEFTDTLIKEGTKVIIYKCNSRWFCIRSTNGKCLGIIYDNAIKTYFQI